MTKLTSEELADGAAQLGEWGLLCLQLLWANSPLQHQLHSAQCQQSALVQGPVRLDALRLCAGCLVFAKRGRHTRQMHCRQIQRPKHPESVRDSL